jgi:PTS system mannose-specific IIA component
MIGIVVVAYGNLAKEFVAVAEGIVGKQERLKPISIAFGGDMDKSREEILQAIKSVNVGKGVVVLVDMFGGVPSNLAISVMNNDDIEVVAGFNLPMLVKMISIRGVLTLPAAISEIQESGRRYINIARDLLEAAEQTNTS